MCMESKKYMQRELPCGVLSVFKHTILFVIILLNLVPYSTNAQSIENRYRCHIDRDGVTYFFCPKKIKCNVNIDMFSYDMTCHTKCDSVILNFTIFVNDLMKVKGLSLVCGNGCEFKGNGVGTLFADIVGKKYEIRTTTKFSFADICTIFSQNDPLSFHMYFDNGVDEMAAYTLGLWKKDSNLITRILDLINSQR